MIKAGEETTWEATLGKGHWGPSGGLGSWAGAGSKPWQQSWPAASGAAPAGALPGARAGVVPSAQHSLLDLIWTLWTTQLLPSSATQRGTISSLPVSTRSERVEPDFVVLHGRRTRIRGHKLKQDWFKLDSLTMRTGRHWNRLPREAVQAPALKVLEGCYKVSPQPSLLQAEQPQLSQPVFIGEVHQPSDHLRGPPLGLLKQVHVLLMLGTTELNTVLQAGSHKSGVEVENHLPPPAGHTSFDAAQDTIGFLGCKCTLPGHTQFFIHQYPQVLLHRAALNPLITQLVCMLGIAPTQTGESGHFCSSRSDASSPSPPTSTLSQGHLPEMRQRLNEVAWIITLFRWGADRESVPLHGYGGVSGAWAQSNVNYSQLRICAARISITS
ncbi:hypothetical protein QYF61_019346 [Mycteria americana]|uniref:Uncharacterized protein n=1 Tax=Mycteria americana TaxID=33587 RepID=A0AAN7NQX0_MYCAM|nr:hypothetical protein QYF61_019346 [Mycteria americana]